MTALTQRAPATHLQTPFRAEAPEAWARYLVLAEPSAASGLSDSDAVRVQHHRDRLLTALQVHDRGALEQAKQDVLAATYLPPGSPAMRRALRELSWRMAGLRLPRRPMR